MAEETLVESNKKINDAIKTLSNLIPATATTTTLGEGGDVTAGEDATKAVQRVVGEGNAYKTIFSDALKSLNQPTTNSGILAKSAAQGLASTFINAYLQNTGQFPKDADIKKFLDYSIDNVFAAQAIKGEAGASPGRVEVDLINPYIQSNYSKQISKFEKESDPEALADKKKEDKRIADLLDLAGKQRGESAQLYGQALEAFQKPLPTFTPEFSQEVLGEIASRIKTQGETARSQVESEQAKRGLTGSSIEAFALGEQDQNTIDSLRQATFDFLMKSGESSQRNREFLATSLFNQAQTMLGAGLQTEEMAIGKEKFGSQQALAQQQLMSQINQFNQTMATNRQQFQSQQALQQQQIQENTSLFNKYINTRSSSGMGIGEILGLTFQGLGAVGGAAGGIGALVKAIK